MPKRFTNNGSIRSASLPLLIFWLFSSLPRIWFFYRSGAPFYTYDISLAQLLWQGFLKDGLLLGLLFLLLYAVQAVVYRTGSEKIFRRFVLGETLFLSALLGIMMVNVEFFRYFGSHTKLEHLSFLKPAGGGMSLFVSSNVNIGPILFEVLFIPLLFVLVCRFVQNWKFDYFFQGKTLLVTALLFFAVGTWASRRPVPNILQNNLTENSIITFLRYLSIKDELKGGQTKSAVETLDPLPLEPDGVKQPKWYFFDDEYPLIKATAHHLCRLGKWDPALCDTTDDDGDGYVLKDDCNDLEAAIHPGAADQPGNGIDEDCSGLDADPPNIIFIHWEGARAVNTGSIGYSVKATPQFDSWVKKAGMLFTNAYSNGTQTRFSLISIYCSILPRLSNKYIFKYKNDIRLLAFPKILRDKGYHTIYAHGGQIDFSSKKFRFKKWFETHFERKSPVFRGTKRVGWGITDRDLFNFSYDYLSKRDDPRPFYMSIATLSLHWPFILPEPEFEMAPHEEKKNQVPNIMRYSDDAMGEFFRKIYRNPKLKNTIILISSDHGLNRYAPHRYGIQNKFYEDLIWIPMALIGKNWNLTPGTVISEVRQTADVGPTILDRLGIEIPNPFIGHSLLRRFPKDRPPRAFFSTPHGGLAAGIRMGDDKFSHHFETKRERLYNLRTDRRETKNLAQTPDMENKMEEYLDMMTSVQRENMRLINQDRLWNWSYYFDEKNN